MATQTTWPANGEHAHAAHLKQEYLAKLQRNTELVVSAVEHLTTLGPQLVLFGSRKIEPTDPEGIYATRLCELLAPKWHIKTGGGPGNMDQALYGCVLAGYPQHAIAIPTNFLIGEPVSRHAATVLPQGSFHFRHDAFFFLTSAYIFMQRGRLGTQHEWLDVLNQQKHGQIAPAPMYLVGEHFWGKHLEVLTESEWPVWPRYKGERNGNPWHRCSPEDFEGCTIIDSDDPKVLAARIEKDTVEINRVFWGDDPFQYQTLATAEPASA